MAVGSQTHYLPHLSSHFPFRSPRNELMPCVPHSVSPPLPSASILACSLAIKESSATCAGKMVDLGVRGGGSARPSMKDEPRQTTEPSKDSFVQTALVRALPSAVRQADSR